MRRRCHTCLCRTCLNTCCDRKNCTGKKEACERYSGFRQLGIFDTPQKSQYHSAPRHSWQHYRITKERYRQLTEYIQSGRYASVARQAAHTANEMIEEYLIKSIVENKSYDKLEFDDKLGRICYGRTDFYGCRRFFYHLFDLELKKIGK